MNAPQRNTAHTQPTNKTCSLSDKTSVKTMTSPGVKSQRGQSENKAPGEDEMDGSLIKQAPASYGSFLTTFSTTGLTTGYFPSPWKTATSTMIHKDPQPPHDLQNR
ncbi:unnamed protein product [Lota lota]